MTWLDIQNQVLTNVSPSATANTILTNNIGKWQERRRDQIMHRKKWWFMKQTGVMLTTPLVRSYLLPPNYMDSDAFWLEFKSPDSFKPLDIRSFWEAQRRYTPALAGTPRIVTLGSNYFSLWPQPDSGGDQPLPAGGTGAYLLKCSFYQFPLVYSLNTDHDVISDEYPDLYIFSLTADGFKATQEYDKAKYWEEQYVALIGDEKVTGSLEIQHNMRMLASPQPWEVRRGKMSPYSDPPTWRFWNTT